MRPDNHNHCPGLIRLLVGSAAFQCSVFIPREMSLFLLCVWPSFYEESSKAGLHPTYPTVIAEKCMNPSECKDLRQNPALPMCRWLILLCSGLLQNLLQSSCTQAGRSVMGTVSGSTGPSSGAYTLKPHRRLLALKKKNDKKRKSSFQHVYHGCCEAALFWRFYLFILLCFPFLWLLLLLAQIVLQ